jgi:zinc/manganese transport system substrate-binding protein
MKRFLLLAVALIASVPAHAAVDVFTCEPEWYALTQELGGDKVKVFAATTALEDPHHVQARPSLIARIRRADLLVCTGAELETGWLPILLRRSANGNIQPGRPGYFEAASFVTLKEVPQHLDRAEGDVHAAGNPHIQNDPRNIAQVAEALGARLAVLDSANASYYQQRLSSFRSRWQEAMQRWRREAAPLRGVSIVTQHKNWIYLIDWLGLKEVATLEPRPGVPPTSAYLSEVLQRIRSTPTQAAIHAAYQDPRPTEWFASHSDIKGVTLPFTVGGTEGANNLFAFFDDTIRRLLEAAR